MHSNLVGATSQRETVYNTVSLIFIQKRERWSGGASILPIGVRFVCYRWVIRQSAEFRFRFFSTGAYTVQPQFRANLHDGLVADHHAFWELALDTSNILFLYCARLQSSGHFLSALWVFSDEHEARSQAIKSVTRAREPFETALGAQNLDDRIEVVPPCGVHRYTGGLINDNEVIILVNYAYGKTCDRGFVAVSGVGDDISILNFCFGVGADAIDRDKACFEGSSLVIVSLRFSLYI